MRKILNTTVASSRQAGSNLQVQFAVLPNAGAPLTRATLLDRQADAELVLGHTNIAERLARMAAELRSAAA